MTILLYIALAVAIIIYLSLGFIIFLFTFDQSVYGFWNNVGAWIVRILLLLFWLPIFAIYFIFSGIAGFIMYRISKNYREGVDLSRHFIEMGKKQLKSVE